jgi:integrase
VLDAAEPRVRMLVMLVSATGMRRDEALHLKWSDIDFEDARVDLRAKRFAVRLRNRAIVEKNWRPKTAEERELYLPDGVLSELRRFRMKQRYSGESDWVSQSRRRRGQQWANPGKMLRLAFMDADNYEKGKLLHAIRHTVASRLVRAVDIECARATLGHRSILTTQRYLHTDGVQRRKAADAIGLVGGKRR